LAFDLSHPDDVKLTARSERLRRDPFTTVVRRRFNGDVTQPRPKAPLAARLSAAPIIAVALDLTDESAQANDALRTTAQRMLTTLPSARLAALNVRRLGRITLDTTLDEKGHNKQIDRIVALRHWAQDLKLDDQRFTAHVLEAIDPAAAILEFATANRVDHILIGAREASMRRKLLGSVSAKVAAEALCSVTIVRPPRQELPASEAADASPPGLF
jgi:nucleotide-binding universal stress UspA family protein